MSARSLAVLGALGLLVPFVAAHSVMYVGPIGFASVPCDTSKIAIGGVVCFEPGHIIPDTSNTFVLRIEDRVAPAVGGFYCQDWNDDSICGDDGTVALVEPGRAFCQSTQVVAAIPDFDATKMAFIFVDGPIFGAFSACGLAGGGIVGVVCHLQQDGPCPPK